VLPPPSPYARKPVKPWHLVLLFLLLGVGYVWAIPIGEAPDEPAHLAFVDHLLRTGSLPPLSYLALAYESYQPPLDYLVSAGCLRLLPGGRPIGARFDSSPDFSFQVPGSRHFLPQSTGTATAAVRRLRLFRLLWGSCTVLLLLRIASIFLPGRPALAVAAAAPWALAPQFLFNSATVNNDTAVVTLATVALLGLCLLLETPDPARPVAWMTGVAVGLAPWGKASGLFLLPPVLFALVVLARRGHRRVALHLLLPCAGLFGAWLVFALVHFGTLWPSPSPAGEVHGANLGTLLLKPWWIASLWESFWAKFGWLNLPLPLPLYVLFVPPTLLAAVGLLCCLRSPRPSLSALGLALVTNGTLLVIFLLFADWQLQGRYLFPSLGALAGLSAIGLGRLAAGWTDRGRTLAAQLLVGLPTLAAVLGIAWIHANYAP